MPRGWQCVGLVWAGKPRHFNDRARSVHLQRLRPILDLPKLAFVALQLGTAGRQAGAFFDRAPLLNVALKIRGFADTRAILDNLDLLISVDTSAAHPAGAIARPGLAAAAMIQRLALAAGWCGHADVAAALRRWTRDGMTNPA